MTQPTYGVAVVGLGYWGPNLLRNFVMNPRFRVEWAVDLSESALARAVRPYSAIRTTARAADALADPKVDLVAIATPVRTHHRLALDAIEAGKHVLMTKPLAATSTEAREMLDAAMRRSRRLLVDHTFLFTPAVRRLKELVESGTLGQVLYVDSVRINLGLFQQDVNVVWDLAPHDLSIILHVLGRFPTSVLTTGMAHTPSGLADIAYVSLGFGTDVIANVHVSWLSPVKVRQMIFGGSRTSVIFNDLEPSEKLRIIDRGISLAPAAAAPPDALRVEYRLGDTHLPALPSREALANEVDHVAAVLDGREEPISDGRMGLQVVEVLEAAQQSLEQKSVRIDIASRVPSP